MLRRARAPYESHDNLSEDVADASNQPLSQVDRSEKSDCLARFARFTKGVPATARRQQRVEAQVDQVHHTHLITASKDNVPTLIRVNKTCQERLTENRHMSMRIVASVQLECKRPRQLSEVLFNVPVPQNWEKTAGLTHLARHNIKNNSGQAHLQRSTTSPSPRRRPAATLKPDRDRNRLPQERDTEDCLARFTKRASSTPALLVLLPLRDDLLRERPAPLRPDAQAAGLVMGVWPSLTQLDSGDRPAIGCWYTSLLPVLSCLLWEGKLVRYVLTDDTRLARPELLEEVEGVCRRRRWDKRKHKHARSDNVTVAVAVRPVAVVVRHLVRGNAVAHVVLVPWCDKKPRKGRPRGCVLTDVTRLARPWRKGDRVGHQNDSLPSVQPVHAREGQSRAIPNVLKSTSRIRMISSLCSAPHDKKDNNVERSPSETWCIRAKRQRQQKSRHLALAVYPRLFSTTLTFRADVVVCPRLF